MLAVQITVTALGSAGPASAATPGPPGAADKAGAVAFRAGAVAFRAGAVAFRAAPGEAAGAR
ncbi:hypothetical protein, partial [Sphaerisporangium perillae]|uniref:hypothetical protein n=1 Tax=Sphaerisporangium perillae TaxID=2935860 RepID=UPI0020104533